MPARYLKFFIIISLGYNMQTAFMLRVRVHQRERVAWWWPRAGGCGQWGGGVGQRARASIHKCWDTIYSTGNVLNNTALHTCRLLIDQVSNVLATHTDRRNSEAVGMLTDLSVVITAQYMHISTHIHPKSIRVLPIMSQNCFKSIGTLFT